jgi:hypothetical protein
MENLPEQSFAESNRQRSVRVELHRVELQVPLEFFMTASDESLQNFALKRLDYAASLEREAWAILKEARLYREAAGVANWLRANRSEVRRLSGSELLDAKGKEEVRFLPE